MALNLFEQLQLVELFEKQYGISRDLGEQITHKFLQSFRACPDNTQTTLDSWRSFLWSQALPQSYRHLSDVIYKNWLQLRYRYLALTQEYEIMLKNLSKFYLLALITNGPSNGQWEKINKLNLKQYFDCILVSSDLPWEKPNPNIFIAACNILNVKPHQCLMIGDKLETDIQGGKEAHFGGTVWLPTADYDASNISPMPDLIVKSPTDILEHLPTVAVGRPFRNGGTMFDCYDELAGTINGRRQRSHSQSTGASTSRKSSGQYRRQTSFPAMDFNDSSCDCS